ncbi:lysylphosphatidylglycerol synthase domain-containing protein [Schumannella luteola]
MKARAVTVVRYVLLAVVVGFAIAFFARQWGDIAEVIQAIPAGAVVLSSVALLIGMLANVLSWVTLLNGLGHVVPLPRGAQIMLVGQLGKYVPGSVWAYVMQMELGRQYGVARARVLVTALYAAGIGVVASLLLGVSIVPELAARHAAFGWLYLLLPIGLVCLHPRVMTWLSNLVLKAFRRPALEHRVRFRTILVAVAWSVLSDLLYGVHLQLLASEFAPATPLTVVMLGAALSLGFTASLIAFVLPSGVGVREFVVIAVLVSIVPLADASALALVSRAMFTAGDLLLAGIAVVVVLVLRRRLRPRDEATSEYE